VAAYVLRLRVALLVGALRGGASHVTRVVVGLTLLAMAVAAACWALLTLRETTPTTALTVTVLAGSAVTLGFALAPLMGGATDPLDPRRFTLLGLPARSLALLLVVAGLISVPVAAIIVLAVGFGAVWARFDIPALPVTVSVVLGILTCVLLARVCMALAAMFLSGRRSRELSGLFVLAVVVVVVPVGVFLSSLEWNGAVPTQLVEAVQALALTPLGAAWAVPGLLGTDPDAATLSLVVAAGTVIFLGAVWMLLVHRVLTTTERPSVVRERAGLGWFAVAPGTPGGAVSARSLLYWSRDRRYIVNILIIPVAAAVTMVPLLVAGVPWELVVLVPVPFAALFLGWLPHNDLAYDSTAVWMHIASGVRGFSDRIGRLVPVLLIGMPLLAVAIPVAISLHGRWALLPALTGVCVALFFGGLGLSSVSSAVAPYAVSRPGESPFQQPQRTTSSGAIAQALVLGGAALTAVPALWFSWRALTVDITEADSALWAGVAAGGTVFLVGLVVGSVAFERRGGRLMEFAEST
jgi:ABC-2 type transport system permease protein